MRSIVTSDSGGPSRRGPVWASLAVALLGALVFLPSVGGEFLNYDDPYLIVGNRLIHEGRVGAILDPTAHREELGSEYLPVRDLSWVIDARLLVEGGRLRPNASVGFRASNLLWYALTCGLATAFLLRLLEAERGAERRRVALLAAALFALHPAHAESAAWISGRKDLVSAALCFACLLAHLRARAEDRAAWYALSAALAGLACLAKSTATALPLLVLAVEVFDPGGRAELWRRRLARALPVFAVCAGAALLAVWVGRQTGVGQRLDIFQLVERLPDVALKDAVILRHYLAVAFVPLGLQINHHGLLSAMHPGGGLGRNAALAFLVLLPLALTLARTRRRLPRFAALWFVGGLLPVLNLIPFSQWVADRFLCLPVLAAALTLAWALAWLGRTRPRLAAALAASLLLFWGSRALVRGLEFRTSFTLWEAQLRAEPDDPLALRHLGEAHFRRGLERQDRAELVEAAKLLERSVQAFESSRPSSPGHQLEAQLLLIHLRAALEQPREALAAALHAARLLERPGATVSPVDRARKTTLLVRDLRLLEQVVSKLGDPADRGDLDAARSALARLGG